MAEKIAIRITPTPATQDITVKDILRLARITQLPSEKVRDRISQGKSITIITPMHPKIEELVSIIKSIGFAVVMGQPNKTTLQPRKPVRASGHSRITEGEWKVGDIIENLYEVKDIKQGGMGAVYIVRHRRWNSMIAVKSLLERLRKNDEDRALFVKEAETWIDIGFHPNIAACYYVRNIQESPRIFIEYVDGGGLNEWITRQSTVGWDLILDLMVQVGDGLNHAHLKGLVHRDVKPANCMMTRDGILKVTDFGLTKRKSTADQVDSADQVEREDVTAAGMGTPGYMAPEMWIPNAEVGPQADIYAFGVMFFELCCGRKPFTIKLGEKKDKLALAHVKQQPPRPSAFRAEIPSSIEEVILKCLRKHPNDRYSSFRQIREELTVIYEDIFKRKFSREAPDEVKLIPDALNNRAVSLMDLNHEDEAGRALVKALEADPHHPEAVYNMGIISWLATGNPDWELVVRLEEVIKAPEYIGRGAHLLGRCLLTIGEAQRALKAAEQSISAEDAAEAWLKPYAVALIGSGKEEDAIKHLETYLAEFPNEDDAIGWIVGALVRKGRMKEAEHHIQHLAAKSELRNLSMDELADTFIFTGLTEICKFQGHTGWITCVKHFPKSNFIISGARDRTLKIWSTASCGEEKSIPAVGEPPKNIWISPDENIAAIGSAQQGSPIKILDLTSGKFVDNLAHDSAVTAVAFSPDGDHILTVEQKGSARLWHLKNHKVAGNFKVPSHTAAAIIFDHSARPTVFLAGMDRMVKKVHPGESTQTIFERGHKDLITSLKVAPDGSRLLSCGRDKQAINWDTETGKVIASFQAHQDQVTEIAVNPIRELCASYDTKGGIKVWNSCTGMVLRTFSPADGEVISMDFTPDGTRLITGGRDMAIKVWDVRGRPITPILSLAKIRPVTKQMKSDRKFKAMIEGAGRAMKRGAFATAYSRLRDSQTLPGYERSDISLDLILRMRDHGKRVGLRGGWQRKLFDTGSGVRDAVFSPSAINILTAQSDHTIKMWSCKTGDCLKILKGHTNLVATVRFFHNGREAVSGGDDRSIRIWDLNTGKNTMILKGHLESVSSVRYSKDGSAVLSASWDRTLRIWRLSDGACLKIYKGHEDNITSAEFLNDGHIVSAGFEGSVKMWETSSGRVLRDLKGHKDKIMCLSVSPSGSLLASGSMDGTVRIWDTRRGNCIRVFEVSESGVRTVAFSQDQNFIVTGGNDGVLRLWSLVANKCAREFQGHSREVTSAEFSFNGRFIISGSSDNTAMFWELDWEWEFQDAKKPAQ